MTFLQWRHAYIAPWLCLHSFSLLCQDALCFLFSVVISIGCTCLPVHKTHFTAQTLEEP